jgi:V/A-type H+-transporting ATPase subunit D
MSLRIPPGRAGRRWLASRIDTARRARDLLDEKRAVLRTETRAAETRAATADEEWQRRAREAETWRLRSALLDGERPLQLAAGRQSVGSEVAIAWRSAMGVTYPASIDVTLPPPLDIRLLGGGSSLAFAADAYREALRAAADAAAARLAYERLDAELSATVRRLRAIETRWLPQHEQALAVLEVALGETERAEAARNRWLARRAEASSSKRPVIEQDGEAS